MRDDRPGRTAALVLAFALPIAWSVAGCGGGSTTTTAQVTPEAQKKTEEYLKNYQKSMFDQHKGKAGKKKAR